MNGKNRIWGNAARHAARTDAVDRLLRAHFRDARCQDNSAATIQQGKDDAQEAEFRNAARLWDETAALKQRPAYDSLLGTPTLRENVISWWHRFHVFQNRIVSAPRLAMASVVVAMVVSGVLILRPRAPDFSTRVAEIRNVPLNDGSVVTLGAKSALDVEFSKGERKVRLAKGEAFFSVSKDRSRPFIVLAGDTRIRVVGTKFNVNYEAGVVRVSVLEGIVEVMRNGGVIEVITGAKAPQHLVKLVAGQQLRTSGSPDFSESPKVESLGDTEPGAWREGWLSYRDAPLSEIVADANRYHVGQIRIGSPSLANEYLTTSFRPSQIDQMLDLLPGTLPVKVQRNPDGSIELRSSDAGNQH